MCSHGPHVEVRSSSFTMWVPGIKPRASDSAAVPLPGLLDDLFPSLPLFLSVYDVHSPVCECDCCTTMQMKRESLRTVRSWCFFTCLRAFLWCFYCVLGASWPASFSSPCRGLQKLKLPVRLLHGSGNLNSDPSCSYHKCLYPLSHLPSRNSLSVACCFLSDMFLSCLYPDPDPSRILRPHRV